MSNERDPEVGSLGEEAARLLAALSSFARDQGSDLGDGLGTLASQAADGVQRANEHLATGAPECTYCPICRLIQALRGTPPEVREHLAVASAALLQAMAGLLATAVPDGDEAGRGQGVERIDLDDTWPEDGSE